MALSNRDRIGQMFELLAPTLEQFIASALSPELPAGSDWTQLVAVKDAKNGITGKQYSPLDPQLQLRMLTENIPHQVKPGWYPFDGQLSQVQKSYASELRDVRNNWAHGNAFSDDDAYRALDTAERLLKSVGAATSADEVAKVRLNLRRVTADRDDKKTLRSAVTNSTSDGLPAWRDVLPPHDDVATNKFQASDFAANLYKVAHEDDDAGKDYSDPTEFFRRTYLTEGLKDLIGRAVRRLAGDANASPVINLQTNFGGGKTHSMLSLWHLSAGKPLGTFPQDVQEVLVQNGYGKIPAGRRRVAIVGNHFAPSGEQKKGGPFVRTMWGELAWQLGGAEGYALVADADRSSTPPGQALHTLLERYAPATILIDEWVAYARSLFGRDDIAGGTFDDQFTFAQALTEAVAATSGVLLAISIPASHTGNVGEPAIGSAEEVGGAHGMEALKRLQNVVRRVADQWRPASSDEAYHIVRRRLFVSPDAKALAAINDVARKVVEYYRKYPDDFPRDARDIDYEERIKRTYPIHPELFDRLYEDWSSLERFQRTRGVLRLMSTVIHALWDGGDASALIMPGSIPLSTAGVNVELTQYLHDSWRAVIDADVDGPHSEPAKIDTEKPLFGQRSLTKRLARTVFFGAAPTIGTAHKGLDTQRVFLGTAVPGDVPGNFHAALTQLGDRATYFYSGSGKYWYDLQANISRRAKDQAERLHREDVWAEIVRRLAGEDRRAGDFARVHLCPEESGDIPDIDEARLVILHPKLTHKRNGSDKRNGVDSTAVEFARKATENRGTANRANRNMLVYLAADEDRMAELDAAVRTYLGWTHVLSKSADLDLTDNQKNQVKDRIQQADQTVSARLLGAYHWALVPTAPNPSEPFKISVTKAEGQAPSLAERVSKRLGNDGALSTQQAAATVRLALNKIPALWSVGHVTVGELWKVYATYPYMPRLRDQLVLNRGVVQQPLLWQQDGFALAAGYDRAGGRYEGLFLPTDGEPPVVNDTTLVVQPARAVSQREADLEKAPPNDGGESSLTVPPGPQPSGTPMPGHKPAMTRFFGSKELSPDRYAVDFKRIADEVIVHLAAHPGAHLSVRIEIEATSQGGFDDNRIRTISENASHLKFDQSSFEET
jgi:predicted AAA+ superfamily ATPase